MLDNLSSELLTSDRPNNKQLNQIVRSDGNNGHLEWLLSDYSAKTWKFKPRILSDEPSRYVINWFYGLEDVSGWDYWVDICKDLCTAKMGRLDKPKLATSSLAEYARALKTTMRFMFLERKCTLFEEISKEDVEAYKRARAKQKLTCSTLESSVVPLHDLYLLRAISKYSLSFDPFCSTTKAQWARANGVADGHTTTLVPREIFFLLNEALKRISHSRGDLELFHTYMELKGAEEKYIASKFKKKTGHGAGELLKRIRELYGAALLVTFLLTAERKHEASLREEADVINLLDSELDILKGRETKTSGSTSGKETEVAVIEEVKDAFKVIMEVTKYTRVISGETKVLLKLPVKHNVAGNNKKHYFLTAKPMYNLLDCFAISSGISLKIRPHMFRRAYSMIWAWRYEVGDLDELSKMLKHNNKLFTERYTSDEDIWAFMPDKHHQMAFEILNKTLLKKVRVSGGASKTLERYGRIIQAKSKLLSSAEIAGFIDELLATGEISIVVHAGGYCVLTKETKGKSKCLSDDGEMDEARRQESRCAGCPNFGIDESREEYWRKRIELHQQVVDKSTKKQLVEKSRAFIADIENAMVAHENNKSKTKLDGTYCRRTKKLLDS
ncbi:conserved hypothetical protein [Vibrio chagasii]|nr:conserved hypothetical protein [Vibrio chagasii]CAH7330352.1 conserved hypothetical protein [Vibrio chagasii]